MNVSTIKSLAWFAAAGLTVALGWTVFDFVQTDRSGRQLFDQPLAKAKLDAKFDSEPIRSSTIHATVITKNFYDLNWTGKPKPVEVKTGPVAPPPTKTTVPVEQLARVLFIQEDSDAPAASRVLIAYKPASKITKFPLGHSLKVGDTLASPHEYAVVESISASLGVTFRFEVGEGEEPRENETLLPAAFKKGVEVAYVGADGEVRRPNPTIAVNVVDKPPPYNPKLTTPIDTNHFQIGYEDAGLFGQDAAGIIAREVRHRRHRDPRTGKFDGIEIQSVQAGGVAARHGAKEGDIIKSINGHPVTSSSEAITFVKNNQESTSTWIVVVENKGRERTVTYESPPQQ
ncbi:MAG: PDZ domain-containing protein [Planctomycetes bacterium]|nr:PDZ domain-containing protein [Planctomycetota bacterium]